MGTETWGGVNSGAAEKRRPVESLSDFDRQFNKKRSEGIGIDLASLAYDFEEGEVNIETVRYMAKRLERELFGMDNDPTSPTY